MDFDIRKLYAVFVGIHLVAIPLYTRMSLLVVGTVVILSIWSILIIAGRLKKPRDLIRVLVLIFSVFLIIAAHGTIFGQQAGTSLLLILSLMKFFEVKSRRDVNIIIFMSYFLIASNFFFSQSPLIALYVFAVVIYLTSVLIHLSDLLNTMSLTQRLFSSGQYVAIAIPFMLILFILFPRLPSPLWGLPKDVNTAKTGLGEELTLGDISQLVSSGDVAFRVVFDGEVPTNNQLYWRGPVLSHFDGRTWTRNNAPPSAFPNLQIDDEDPTYTYTVTLEPHDKKWLIALEHPKTIDKKMRLTRELQLKQKKPVSNVISYKVTSSPVESNFSLFERERLRNLQVPDFYNPRTSDLAQEFDSVAKGDPEMIVNLALEYFRNGSFYYSLSPPLLGNNSIDDFLFETRKGFCAHYASSFVSLMRHAGIPSRIVTGYQGGTLNPIDDYMIVRQSDAHAWAEVWIDGRGWVRVDPTAAVSPSRIESGISQSGVEQNRLPPLLVVDNKFIERTRYFIDSMQNSWNNWVIGYNQTRQKQLFASMGIEKLDSAKLTLWLVLSMTFAGVVIALLTLRKKKEIEKDPALRFYRQFCQKFKAAGLKRAVNEAEGDFLMRIKKAFPKNAREAELITTSFQKLRYADYKDESFLKNFISTVKKFRVQTE